MQELINKIISKTGISAEQAGQALDTVKEYIKEKFPMVAGAVDNLFAGDKATTTSGAADSSFLDKISDVIPGAMGEKIEQFAKDNAGKAEGVIDTMKDKLGDLLGGKK
ncbi:MAG: hypothetical protein KF880_02560 [Ferruginibacter sp.]|nr:hypothetical protein [Ferruginibacter sp.]